VIGRRGASLDDLEALYRSRVLATSPRLIGDRSAEMSYSETPAGARVFAAGTITFTASLGDRRIARMLGNVWSRLTR